MSECMLCQSRRAGEPHLIEPVGLRIWSIEELLYFIQENLPLLDEEILNQKLVAWIKDELHMRRLAGILGQVAGRPFAVRDFVLPMFHETGYPGEDAIRRTIMALEDLDALPTPVRLKKKADALVGHRRYLRAIETYRTVLEYRKSSNLGAQFTGMIYNNIGCTYARLFQMEEACAYLQESYALLHTAETLRRWLYAIYLRDGREAFLQTAQEQEIDPEMRASIEEAIARLETGARPEKPDEALSSWVQEYHRNTGM